MPTNETLQPIPSRLFNAADGGHVAGADMIYDDTLEKEQSEINQEVYKFSALDIPIPFESTCDIKPYLVKSFGGLTGGSTGIPGIRGEVTFKQARAVVGVPAYKPSALSGTFNEWVYFPHLEGINCFYPNNSGFSSIKFPEGKQTINTRELGYGDVTIPTFIDCPSSFLAVGSIPRNTITFKFHGTTVPSITIETNTHIAKVYVPTGMKQQFLSNTEWAKLGDSAFEEYDE